MHLERAHVLSRLMFGMACLSPLLLGDGALRARAEVPQPYEDCTGSPIAPADYEANLTYWNWMKTSVYDPMFGASAPFPACERGIVLAHEPRNNIVYGEPDPTGAELPMYDPTVRETIPGHRFTDAGALPISVQVLRYEKIECGEAWGEAASLDPSAGLLFAVFSGPAGSVAVLSQVLTLGVQYEPEDTCGCCLPDGTCPVLISTDCLAQGGTPAPLGPIGDLDGDGCDDACIYPPDRYTTVVPVTLLNAQDVQAVNTYESVLRELAGICSGPVGFDPAFEAPEFLTTGTGGVDCSAPTVLQCIADYKRCRTEAAKDYRDANLRANAQYAAIAGGAVAAAGLAFKGCKFLGHPIAVGTCVAAVAVGLAIALKVTYDAYRDACRANNGTYLMGLDACRAGAEAGGCLDCMTWPI
ncbi:MAG: hypothetical protein KBH81_08720 [Phycisphaerae bacterium]|nr:hypothetical protein [Phycisphaerae bacterium]